MGLWEVRCCLHVTVSGLRVPASHLRVIASSKTARLNHRALSSLLSALVSGQTHMLSSVWPHHPTPSQSRPASRPWASAPHKAKPRAHSVHPAGQPHRRPKSEAGPAAAQVKCREEVVGRPRPGQGGQAEGSLGGIQKGPCGSRGEAEPGDGWAPHGTGCSRRLPWMGSGCPGLATRQALHAHSDLGAVTTEKPAWPPFEEGRAARPGALGWRKGHPNP